MLIDTHAHLQHTRFADDLDATLARAVEHGVTSIIVPGSNLADSRTAVSLAERYAAPQNAGPRSARPSCALFAAVGIHPTEAGSLSPATLAELRELAQHPRVVAIGEIGLDYYWPNVPNRGWPCAEPSQQRAALEAQLTLAAELSLPVILHDRDAHSDILEILRAWMHDHPERSGTLHAYAGGPDLLPEALALNLYIGMDGPVTFEKAAKLHEVARQAPLERLLLETDAPYLTPHPYRGRRNEPAYLTYVVERIAALKGIPVEVLASATATNAQRLFQLSSQAN